MNTNEAPNFDLEFNEATRETPHGSPPTSETPSPEIPEKYRGKSVEEVIRMHQEAEKLASRVGNDLAEQRRLTDVLLDLKKNDNAKVPEKKPITTDELFQDPNKAIEQAIAQSKPVEAVKETQQRLDMIERRIGQKEFESKFPTYKEDVTDPAFRDWVLKNPARTALAANADRFDYQAAEALWDMWSEHKELSGNRTNPVEEDRRARTRAASTVRSGAGETSRSKTIISRSKLMELRILAAQGDPKAKIKMEDPDFQRELAIAYEEGRVR